MRGGSYRSETSGEIIPYSTTSTRVPVQQLVLYEQHDSLGRDTHSPTIARTINNYDSPSRPLKNDSPTKESARDSSTSLRRNQAYPPSTWDSCVFGDERREGGGRKGGGGGGRWEEEVGRTMVGRWGGRRWSGRWGEEWTMEGGVGKGVRRREEREEGGEGGRGLGLRHETPQPGTVRHLPKTIPRSDLENSVSRSQILTRWGVGTRARCIGPTLSLLRRNQRVTVGAERLVSPRLGALVLAQTDLLADPQRC